MARNEHPAPDSHDPSPCQACPTTTSEELRAPRRLAVPEHVGVGIVEVDCEGGRLRRVNPPPVRADGLFGSRVARAHGCFRSRSPQDADLDRAQFRRQVAGEIESYTIETRPTAAMATPSFWARRSRPPPSRMHAGPFLYAVRVQHDITDRKQAEGRCSRSSVNEQAALFTFVERLQHAPGPPDEGTRPA